MQAWPPAGARGTQAAPSTGTGERRKPLCRNPADVDVAGAEHAVGAAPQMAKVYALGCPGDDHHCGVTLDARPPEAPRGSQAFPEPGRTPGRA
jgi:hypothetical protein